MLRRIILPVMLAVLAWGFWVSPEFKEIAAGVAIFLFGMMALEQGFKAFSGGVLEKLLNASTDRVWKSQAFGFISTAIMQSSSLVSVITISFLSAGLIALPAGIGIIFGANIGTTTGAWLVAGLGLKVEISVYALPLIVFCGGLGFQEAKNLKGLGY
nr:Na/Pi symporter [Alphaproteobacteria bacterium]